MVLLTGVLGCCRHHKEGRRLDFCSNSCLLLHLVITSVVHNTNWHLGNALHIYTVHIATAAAIV